MAPQDGADDLAERLHPDRDVAVFDRASADVARLDLDLPGHRVLISRPAGGLVSYAIEVGILGRIRRPGRFTSAVDAEAAAAARAPGSWAALDAQTSRVFDTFGVAGVTLS